MLYYRPKKNRIGAILYNLCIFLYFFMYMDVVVVQFNNGFKNPEWLVLLITIMHLSALLFVVLYFFRLKILFLINIFRIFLYFLIFSDILFLIYTFVIASDYPFSDLLFTFMNVVFIYVPAWYICYRYLHLLKIAKKS